jgi:DNA-binding response OmpR family regulator
MQDKPHILVVDDEADVRDVIRMNLEREGFSVSCAADGPEALDMLSRDTFEAAILDVMMPGMDGLALCRSIREDNALRGLPIMLLTARDSEMDQIIGLEVGADDFLSKSASPRLITTRIKAMLRRTEKIDEQSDSLQFGSLHIDLLRQEIRDKDGPISLTTREFALLQLFAENPSRVFSRQDLLGRIWGDDVIVTERTVDVHLKNLRKKIGAEGNLIETVRGVGYRVRRID